MSLLSKTKQYCRSQSNHVQKEGHRLCTLNKWNVISWRGLRCMKPWDKVPITKDLRQVNPQIWQGLHHIQSLSELTVPERLRPHPWVCHPASHILQSVHLRRRISVVFRQGLAWSRSSITIFKFTNGHQLGYKLFPSGCLLTTCINSFIIFTSCISTMETL